LNSELGDASKTRPHKTSPDRAMPTPIAKPTPAQARLYALGLAYLVGNVITTPSAAAELYFHLD
jgi:hypothetical protein